MTCFAGNNGLARLARTSCTDMRSSCNVHGLPVPLRALHAGCSIILYKYESSVQLARATCTDTRSPCNVHGLPVPLRALHAGCSIILYKYEPSVQPARATCTDTRSSFNVHGLPVPLQALHAGCRNILYKCFVYLQGFFRDAVTPRVHLVNERHDGSSLPTSFFTYIRLKSVSRKPYTEYKLKKLFIPIFLTNVSNFLMNDRIWYANGKLGGVKWGAFKK